MKSSDIDSDYITRRTTVTPAMADDIAAFNEELQEQREVRHVEREARSNQGSAASNVSPTSPVLADFEQREESDKRFKAPIS